jgi:hypothetical protein
MNFSDRITMLTDTPPKGTPKYVTPEEYAKLEGDDRYSYCAEWPKYRTRKVRSYETCELGHTHFMGWEEERIGIGKPYRYSWRGGLFPKAVKGVMGSNVLMARILATDK